MTCCFVAPTFAAVAAAALAAAWSTGGGGFAGAVADWMQGCSLSAVCLSVGEEHQGFLGKTMEMFHRN